MIAWHRQQRKHLEIWCIYDETNMNSDTLYDTTAKDAGSTSFQPPADNYEENPSSSFTWHA